MPSMDLSSHIRTLRRLITECDRKGVETTTTVNDAHESLDEILIAMACAGLLGSEEKDSADPPEDDVEPWTLALMIDGAGGVSTVPTHGADPKSTSRRLAAWLVLRPRAMELLESNALTQGNVERLVRSRSPELLAMNVVSVEIRESMADGGVRVTTVDLGSDPLATR